jgi:hypothetical protein
VRLYLKNVCGLKEALADLYLGNGAEDKDVHHGEVEVRADKNLDHEGTLFLVDARVQFFPGDVNLCTTFMSNMMTFKERRQD